MEAVIRKKSRGINSVSLLAELGIHVVIGIFALLCILPFIFVVIISFSSKASIAARGYSFVPAEWSIQAYQYAINLGAQLWRSYFNSFFTTAVGTALAVLICILYSYALYRKDYPWRKFFMFFAFFTMIFGGGLVPTIMICKNVLGLNDNYAALIVPLLVNPFNFVVMRTFFSTSIHESLIESAAIEGSGEYRTLFSIVVPLAKPGIATIALLNVLAYWNEWILAMLYIKNEKLIPLQYLLWRMQMNVDFLLRNSGIPGVDLSAALKNMPGQSLRMALCVFIVIPVAFAYPFFQRYIIAGLTIGAVKE